MNKEFELIKEENGYMAIENINYKIEIYIFSRTLISIMVYYKKSCVYRTYDKSKDRNYIPLKYRETIDSFLVLHQLMWGN
jgi:hypothetical protein